MLLHIQSNHLSSTINAHKPCSSPNHTLYINTTYKNIYRGAHIAHSITGHEIIHWAGNTNAMDIGGQIISLLTVNFGVSFFQKQKCRKSCHCSIGYNSRPIKIGRSISMV